MPAPIAPGSIKTSLNYVEGVPDKAWTTDFTKPGAEKHFEEFERYKTSHPTTIVNIRGREDYFCLFENGFEYVKHDVPALKDSKTEEEVADILIPATEQLVKTLTGATKTVVIAHRVRSKAEDENRRADNKAPALAVHSDFTPAGANARLDLIIKDETEREELRKGRVMILNVWRPLKTIRRDPLAVCDWRSVNFTRDWNPVKMIMPNEWSEYGAVSYDPEHRWCYLQHQEPSEPLVFLQYDSKTAADGGMCVAHSAFVDPAGVDAEPRESIEIKVFAFVPDPVA